MENGAQRLERESVRDGNRRNQARDDEVAGLGFGRDLRRVQDQPAGLAGNQGFLGESGGGHGVSIAFIAGSDQLSNLLPKAAAEGLSAPFLL